MTSLNSLDTHRLIWSPFRSFRAIQGKRQQNYLYYKHATILKFAPTFFGTQSDTVWDILFFKIDYLIQVYTFKGERSISAKRDTNVLKKAKNFLF